MSVTGANKVSGPISSTTYGSSKAQAPVGTEKEYDLSTSEGKMDYLRDYCIEMDKQAKTDYKKYEKRPNHKAFSQLVTGEILRNYEMWKMLDKSSTDPNVTETVTLSRPKHKGPTGEMKISPQKDAAARLLMMARDSGLISNDEYMAVIFPNIRPIGLGISGTVSK